MSRSVLLAFGLVITLLACASTAEEADPDAPETCFTIDNSEGGGPAGRVYLVSASKQRTRLGEVPMGRELKRCLRRSTFGGGWNLIVELASSDRIDPAHNELRAEPVESQEFFITPGDQIVWNVHLNVLRYVR